MSTITLSCDQANQMDMVAYLAILDYNPRKVRNDDYWYLSPLRVEETSSFKINRRINVWFDHGLGKGGTLIDFGIVYHHCSVKELLLKLSEQNLKSLSFHPQNTPPADQTSGENVKSAKIEIINASEIKDDSLLEYLNARGISLATANQFCKEVNFILYGKSHKAIGFPNDSGGYELRNAWFKGSSSPKASRFMDNGSTNICVFEGFFDLLSFQDIQPDQNTPSSNFLILNSLAFFQKAKDLMEKYEKIHLYLDRDPSGFTHSLEVLNSNSRYIDESILYQNFKDLNEWLVKTRSQTQSLKLSQERAHKQHKIKRHGGL